MTKMKAEKTCEKFVGSKECGKPAACKVHSDASDGFWFSCEGHGEALDGHQGPNGRVRGGGDMTMHYTRIEAIAEIVRRTDVDAADADAYLNVPHYAVDADDADDAAGGCTDARTEAIIADILVEREERAKEAAYVQELDRKLAAREQAYEEEI